MSKRTKNLLAESLIYPKDLKERMHPKLEEDLLSYQQIYGKVPVDKQIYFMKKEILDFNTLLEKFNKFK